MKEVGEQFSKGEIILPFVLQSSEIMRAATLEIEKYIQKKDQTMRGNVLLATVYGDVHDIGKNLVKTILENNGFVVIDLGKQVPADLIVETALDEGVTAIGLSALLVNTSQQMPIIIEKLRALNSSIPVLIGGAAVNEPFARKIEKDNKGSIYGGGVYYCKDAFEALSVLDGLQAKEKRHS
jgi:5-methyltetrahydrofolate--homocysteine methyltransferase